MKHYVEANISRKSSTTIKYALKVVRYVSGLLCGYLVKLKPSMQQRE